MSQVQGRSLERAGFEALCSLLLAPLMAQGLFRPLAHFVGPTGSGARITLAALVVGALVLLVGHLASRRLAWLALVLGGVVALAISMGLAMGLAGSLTLVVVASATNWLHGWLPSRLPSTFDGLVRRHPFLTSLYVLFGVFAVVSMARVSIYIGDPARVEYQALPGNEFTETHSCLTAYVRALELARAGADNLYEDRWWSGSLGLPAVPQGAPNPYAPFHLDNLSYPPPFLLVASVLRPLDGDFYAQRALWFGLNGLLLAFGLWIVARWIDGPRAHRALLLAPLFFGSLPVLLTLQIGNFHIAAVVLSVLAMVAFDRGRSATGGAALALTILSKVSPGVLGIVLLFQRRFRVALVTASFGVLLTVLTVVCFGTGPIRSFLGYALPRLSAGTAFPFMGSEAGIVTNMSPFGVPFKLQFLGLHVGDPWLLGPRIARVYTALLVVVTVVAARRKGDRREQAITWMALLVLAALQSPFAPAYVTLGLLWATNLLAAEVRTFVGALGLVFIWLVVLVVPPGLPPSVMALQSMAQTALIMGICLWLILRAPARPGPAAAARLTRIHGRTE